MKTLHLTNAWHAKSGGIGTFYRALMDAANREGHFMRLIVPAEATRTEEAGPFARIYHIKAPRAPINPDYRMMYPHHYLVPGAPIHRILNEEQPDLIEVSDKYTMHYLAGLLRVRALRGVKFRPSVIGLSHERMDENMAAYLLRGKRARWFCRLYMKCIYFPMFDHHMTISRYTAEELSEASRGHKVRRGIWIEPMGVDADRFTPTRASAEKREALMERIGAREGATVLLYAGRLAPEKNVRLLVETMAELSNEYHLAIAGQGILQGELETECRRRRLANVTFLGHVSDREELADIYANADIFLHPNAKEPFGIAPLESLASGMALIAPDSGGVITYASDENAWLSKADARLFANSAIAIRRRPEEAARRRIEARRTAETFSWPNVTSRLLAVYREVNAMVRGGQAAGHPAPAHWSTLGDYFGREIEA